MELNLEQAARKITSPNIATCYKVKNIKLRTRLVLLNSLVRSRHPYGWRVWQPVRSEVSKLLYATIFADQELRLTSTD